MRNLSEFFHFHHGTPTERAAKIIGSVCGAIALATTATAMTMALAADHAIRADALHILEDCTVPTPGLLDVADDHVAMTWTTTVPTDDNRVTVDEPARSREIVASGRATAHTATVAGLATGTTYRYRLRSTDSDRGRRVETGTCTFTTLGPDRTPPTMTDVTTRDVRMDRAIIDAIVSEPGTITIRIQPIPTIMTAATTEPRTTEQTIRVPQSGPVRIALTDLDAGTTYDVRITAYDLAEHASDPLTTTVTTLRAVPTDDAPPAIRDLVCTRTPNGIVVRFRIPEVPAFGRIAYGNSVFTHAVEAAPATDGTSTTLIRTITDITPTDTFRVRATAMDPAGNTTTSSPLPCP